MAWATGVGEGPAQPVFMYVMRWVVGIWLRNLATSNTLLLFS